LLYAKKESERKRERREAYFEFIRFQPNIENKQLLDKKKGKAIELLFQKQKC